MKFYFASQRTFLLRGAAGKAYSMWKFRYQYLLNRKSFEILAAKVCGELKHDGELEEKLK